MDWDLCWGICLYVSVGFLWKVFLLGFSPEENGIENLTDGRVFGGFYRRE